MQSLESSSESALQMMEEALKILDAHNIPMEIAATLDLAIERLYAHLNLPRAINDQLTA